jgi:hypothetical protein
MSFPMILGPGSSSASKVPGEAEPQTHETQSKFGWSRSVQTGHPEVQVF